MTTGKTIALTRWTFVGKVMSLLLNNFWQIHGVLYSAPQCHIDQFYYSKFPWAATLQSVSPSLLPESLEMADVFCDLIVLLFPEWHIHEIIPHALFYVWLLSLNEMQWRLIHVVWIVYRRILLFNSKLAYIFFCRFAVRHILHAQY